MERFYKPKSNQLETLKQSLPFIEKTTAFYNKHLVNKKVFVKTDKSIYELSFAKHSIFHLLGIKHKQGNRQFWVDISKGKLVADQLLIQDFTFAKLQAMHDFQNIFLGNSYFNSGFSMTALEVDKAINTNKPLLLLGLGLDARGVYYPKTAIDLRQSPELWKDDEKVLEVYTIKRGHSGDEQERIYLKKQN